MYIPLTILIAILSFFSIGEKIGNFLLKHKKYVSGFLYTLTLLSLTYLTDTTDGGIHSTGERTYDVLMLLLFLPILAKVFNFSLAKKLMIFRKELGILMGILAMVHGLQYFLADSYYQFWDINFWILDGTITHVAYGFIALLITIVLTVTSNKISIKKLGKYWKKIHRFVYVLLFFGVLHVFFFIYGTDEFIPKLLKYGIPLIFYIIGKILEWKNIQLRK